LWRLVPTLAVSTLGSGEARQQFEAFGITLRRYGEVRRSKECAGENSAATALLGWAITGVTLVLLALEAVALPH